MAVYVSNIVIEQGFDFDTSFQLQDTRTNSPIILSSTTSEAMLRKHYGATTAVSFATTVTDPDEGILSISLNSSQTQDLKPGRYVFDVKLTNDGNDFKAIEGVALVRAGVTR
tara:strand:+ start:1150 stop:1485 length:336 start_codon:yes stop_codon:yes gene_type:complete